MAALIPRPDYPPYSARSADEGREEVDGILSRMEHKVHKEYLQAAREMKKKADDYLAQFLAEDERRAKMVAEGKMSAAEWKQWRISHIATGRRWYEQAAVLAEDMTNANKIAAGIINGELPEVFATGFNYALYQGEITGGFQTSFTLYDRETVARLLKEEPELMPIEAKINVPKDMLWNTKQLTSAMTQAIVQGEKIEDIALRLVSSVAGMNENTAIRNARTATTSAENGGRYNGYRKLKAAGADLTIEWCATLDGRTRHTHRMLDGQRRDVDKPFEVDGQKILYAGDPYAPQGLVWNCRCTLLCWVKGFEESLMLKAQTHPDGMSYAEWKYAKQEEYERRKAEPKKPRVNPDNPAYGYSADFQTKDFTFIESRANINLARPLEMLNFNDLPSPKYTAEEILDNLETTAIGRETLQIIETLPEPIKFEDYDDPSGVRGHEENGIIEINLRNCKSVLWAARTIIHETTHYRYGIGECQWAECVCVAQELKHARNVEKLSRADLRLIIDEVQKVYSDKKWRKGGKINGRKKR